MWLLPVHVPMAADTAVVLPQLLEQVRERLSANKNSTKQVQERRTKIEAIYRATRQKSQEWIEKTWNEKPISQARFFTEINRGYKENPGRWCRRMGGAGAKRSR